MIKATCYRAMAYLALLTTGAVAVPWASAQGVYPTRPVRFVVPYPPGGSMDPTARLIGGALTNVWGQQVVVENRAGGDTIIGSTVVATAPPDGHTVLYTSTTFVLIPLLHKNLPYQPFRDFATVGTVATNEKLLVTHPSVPSGSLQEFITYAKANPGKLNFAMTVNGSANHLASEMFNVAAGARALMVPYKGAGPALTDLMGGHVQLAFALPVSVIQHVQRGAIRGVALSGKARLPQLPNIPTFDEAGMPNLEIGTWQGILAPAKVPRAIINKIAGDVAKILTMRDVQEKLNAQGSTPFNSTPEQMAALMKTESARYAKVVEAVNIKL